MDTSNWLALLRWSLENGDGTQPTDVSAMSAEDKAFIEAALKDAVKDETARMNELMTKFVTILKEEDGPIENVDFETIEDELEELRDIIEQLDMAQVFAKFGGLRCLTEMLQCEKMPLSTRALAASTMATICQNHIMVQDFAYSQQFLDRCMEVWRSTSSNNSCLKLMPKILFAISCMVRGHAALEECFVQRFSSDLFPTVLASNHGPLIVRGCFLANALMTSDTCTEERVQKLTGLLLPNLLRYISGAAATTDATADVHDVVLRLIETLLRTEVGQQQLLAPTAAFYESLRQELDTRERELRSVIDDNSGVTEEELMNREEAKHHLELMSTIRNLIVTGTIEVQYPSRPNNSRSIASVESQNQQTPKAVSDDEKKIRGAQFSNPSALMVSPPPAGAT